VWILLNELVVSLTLKYCLKKFHTVHRILLIKIQKHVQILSQKQYRSDSGKPFNSHSQQFKERISILKREDWAYNVAYVEDLYNLEITEMRVVKLNYFFFKIFDYNLKRIPIIIITHQDLFRCNFSDFTNIRIAKIPW
jgi:hypothetical protein